MGGKNPCFFDFPKTPSKTCILALLGGGTPSPPLPPPKRLYKEKTCFFPLGWALHDRVFLSGLLRGVKGDRLIGKSLFVLFSGSCRFFIKRSPFTPSSVRTRNTLHEVGAPSQRVRDSAVSPRVRWECQNDNYIMRTTTSHFLFIIISSYL